jgi:hypothetical protein
MAVPFLGTIQTNERGTKALIGNNNLGQSSAMDLRGVTAEAMAWRTRKLDPFIEKIGDRLSTAPGRIDRLSQSLTANSEFLRPIGNLMLLAHGDPATILGTSVFQIIGH